MPKRLPGPPSNLLTEPSDDFAIRRGGTEENSRLVEIVGPFWNELAKTLETKGLGELIQIRHSLQEQLEQEDRNLIPFDKETALLNRLQDAFLAEARKHGVDALVAKSVVPDRPPLANEWWFWRTLSFSTLVLDCAEPDEIWDTVAHPCNFAKAYSTDTWDCLIGRTHKTLNDSVNRSREKLERRNMLIFHKELTDNVISYYTTKPSIKDLYITTPIPIAPNHTPENFKPAQTIGSQTNRWNSLSNDEVASFSPKKIEFIVTAYNIISGDVQFVSVSRLFIAIDLQISRKINSDPSFEANFTWGKTAAKRMAIDLGIYDERDKRGRPSEKEIKQALEVFQDAVRGLAERLREAGVNIAE